MPLLVCASPKGGVGKTTLAANLADALRRSGRPVLALDLDPQNALRLHLGLSMNDTAGFCLDLLRRPGRHTPDRHTPVTQAPYRDAPGWRAPDRHPSDWHAPDRHAPDRHAPGRHSADWRAAVRETPSGVGLLPHGSSDLRDALTLGAALQDNPELLAGPLREMLADPALVVVVDTPPGASAALAAVLPMASLVLVVLLADAGSTALLPDLESGRFLGRGTLANLFAARMRVALNQVDPASRLSASVADALARHLGPRLLGAVCRDDAVGEALASQRLLAGHAPRSRAAEDVADLARAILHAMPPAPAAAAAVPDLTTAFATPPFAAPWGLR